MQPDELIASWAAQGAHVPVDGEDVWAARLAAAGPATAPPLLFLHGFPTSSIDLALVVDELRAAREVVVLDLPGFGLSTKADRPASLFAHADVTLAVLSAFGIDEVDLLTHDMGDSVGGELLARELAGAPTPRVRRRVLTNGSIYMDLARLTDGQQMLLSLEDAVLPAELAPDVARMHEALAATLAADGAASDAHLRAAAALVVRDGGARLLARTIRYVEERRRYEWRWTGAIERHRAPLTVLWGDEDPIAVWDMAERLAHRRRDAACRRLEGVGHYPMLEAPRAFAAAVVEALG